MKFATTHGRRQRQEKRSRQSTLRAKMTKRIAAKKSQKAAKERKQLERELKTGHVQAIIDCFSLDARRQEDLTDILEGRVVGRNMDAEEGVRVMYNGRVARLHQKSAKYVIAYWSQNEDFADAEVYDMPVHEVAVDFVLDDLALC